MQARLIALVTVLAPTLMLGLLGSGQAFAAGPDEPAAIAPAATVAPAPSPALPDLAARVADLEAYINNTRPRP